jgi:hypothetical protein
LLSSPVFLVKLTHPIYFDPEDGGRKYLRNVSYNCTHPHGVNAKN